MAGILMNNRRLKVGLTVVIFVGGMFLFSCEGNFSEKKKNYDSLFLNISLGMGKKEFYDHCWEMNRQKIFIHGPTNQNVEYKLRELKHPVTMRFYPTFYKEKIFEMPVTFTYESWAPWNRQFFSDSLLVEMVGLFSKWYGDFKVIEHKTQGTVYYRMDGHRRINLFIKDDQFVQAVFTDLRIEKELKKKYVESLQQQQ
jgi:hypothetical protein